MNTTTMRERFDEKFPLSGEWIPMKNGKYFFPSENIKHFIEQELKLKDQEHKAELDVIKNRVYGQLNERSMIDGTIYLSDAKQAVSDIFDSHINK